MSTIALDNRGGEHRLARVDHDHVQCVRCGIWRKARPGVNICVDCKTVEREAARMAAEAPVGRPWTHNGVTTWAAPMSAEDMAWCEKQANAGFWRQWEQLNRRDAVTPAVMQKALNLSRDASTARVENQCTSDLRFSTRSVDKPLHESGESVFDEGMPTTDEGVA